MTSLVLCSGGWESAAVAVIKGWPLLFVDYGQSYAKQERVAVTRLAVALGVPLYIRQQSVDRPRRNFDLMRIAKNEGAEEVALGCRAVHRIFDRYGDCHPAALRREADALGLRLSLPLFGLPDFMVRRIAERGMASRIVFSSKGLAM
jgi:7-cyano-7-deazaguanine synthase in queuosine biosynthesis